jgi:hypothetical protein
LSLSSVGRSVGEEKAAFESLNLFNAKRAGYRIIMGTRPQTLGYALTDSPVGLAGWMYDYNDGEPQRTRARR